MCSTGDHQPCVPARDGWLCGAANRPNSMNNDGRIARLRHHRPDRQIRGRGSMRAP